MQPQNNSERSKMRSRFLVLYIVTIALIAVVFAALWPSKTKPDVTSNGTVSKEIADTDKSLHEYLDKLHQLDEDALNAMTDSAFENKSDLLRRHLQSIDSNSTLIEKNINSKIDLLSAMGRGAKEKEMSSYANDLSGSYELALKNHRSLTNLRSILALNLDDKNDNVAALMKWQNDLQKKEDIIEKLEKQVRSLQQEIKFTKNAIEKPANSLSITSVPNNNDKLVSENQALRSDNDRLILEVGRMRKNNEQEITSKQSEMQKRVNDLTAQLYLAQVDCNLTRADAKQVVYSSRQRKELLTQALKLLTNLSENADAGLKEELKEKSRKLQAISNDIRD